MRAIRRPRKGWPQLLCAAPALGLILVVLLFKGPRWGPVTALGRATVGCERPAAAADAQSKLQQYLQHLPNMRGWMHRIHAGLVHNLTTLQRQYCVEGAVGEIGVFHGKFFFAIASTASRGEQKVAVDLWEEQEKNVDNSGGTEPGRLAAFQAHAAALGYSEADITTVAGDSTQMGPETFSDLGVPAFRLLSVDGGHAFETALSDLQLASELLEEKGIFIVDDVGNPSWVGVLDAVAAFVRSQGQVAPFLWTCGKMYFVSAPSHALHLSWAKSHPCIRCTSTDPGLTRASYSLGSWEVCISDPYSTGSGCECIQ